MIFTTFIFIWFFKNHAISKVFQTHRRQQAFFSKMWCRVGEMRCDSHGRPHAFLNVRGDRRLVVHVLWTSLSRPSPCLSFRGPIGALLSESEAGALVYSLFLFIPHRRVPKNSLRRSRFFKCSLLLCLLFEIYLPHDGNYGVWGGWWSCVRCAAYFSDFNKNNSPVSVSNLVSSISASMHYLFLTRCH